MSWELSPSVETHGSYGFGFFPQFSVGLVWPAPCSPISGTGISGAAGLQVAQVELQGTQGSGCRPRGTCLARGAEGPEQHRLGGAPRPHSCLADAQGLRGHCTRSGGIFK